MKHFYKILVFFVIMSLTACSNDNPKTCKNTCPSGQKQNKDCSCHAPQKMQASESQQREILQAIINGDDQNLLQLINTIAADSTFNLDVLQNNEDFKQIYARKASIANQIINSNNLTLLFLLAPLDNFNRSFDIILKNGANPNLQIEGITPLEIAIESNQGEKVKMLLEAGADFNSEEVNNILHTTLITGKYKSLNALSNFIRQQQTDFKFPPDYFINAMINNNAELANAVAPLTDQEILNMPNNFGVLPLVQAAFTGKFQLMDTLVNSGANLELKDQNYRPPMLAYLQEIYIAQIEGNYPLGRDKQITETVKHFLEIGADISVQDYNGENIMFYAVRGNNKPLIELLITNYNQNLNSRNNQGETPLFIAAQNTPALVPYLLSKGANPKVMDKNGRTPAIAAVELGNIETYDLLESAAARTQEV